MMFHMVSSRLRYLAIGLTPFVTGCATTPIAPSILVLPGAGISYTQFTGDDVQCRQAALFRVDGQGAAIRPAGAPVVGIGGGGGLGGTGGSVMGGGVGTIFPVSSPSAGGYGPSPQYAYDMAYIQCMYARGHRVPLLDTMRYEDNRSVHPAASPEPENPRPPPAGPSP